MRINHNMGALNTYRQLTSNQVLGSKSLEKLSSGLRINRAGDDAAGLAISEKMRSQIRGLEQSSRNSQDAISLIQTAEGALNETHSILQRMRELATQAGNDTNTSSDRDEMQKEINQLTSEINRIGNTTEFNTQKLLNGNVSTTATMKGQSGFAAGTTGLSSVSVSTDSSLAAGSYCVNVTCSESKSVSSSTLCSGVSSVSISSTSSMTCANSYKIVVTQCTIKGQCAATTGTIDGGVCNINVASNSSLTAEVCYKVVVSRTDYATSQSYCEGTACLSITATGAGGFTAGIYCVKTTFETAALAAGTNGTMVCSVSITCQTKFNTFSKGGDNFYFANVGTCFGQVALHSCQGTVISCVINLDDGQQCYAVYADIGGAVCDTGLVLRTAAGAATTVNTVAFIADCFRIDAVMNAYDCTGNNIGSCTVEGGCLEGTKTITTTCGGTISVYQYGMDPPQSGCLLEVGDCNMTIGSVTFTIGNCLTAQLQDNAGTAIGASVSFAVACDNIYVGGGVRFDADTTASSYSATTAECSWFKVASCTQNTANLQTSGGAAVSGAATCVVLTASTSGVSFGNGVTFDVGATITEGTTCFNVNSTESYSATLSTGGTAVATCTLTASCETNFGSGFKVLAGSSLAQGNATVSVTSASCDGSLTMQIGANQGQTFTVDVNDMRSVSIGISGASASDEIYDENGDVIEGASYTSTANVTNGTTNDVEEYALDVSDATKASAAIKVIDVSIKTVSAERSKLGAFQNRLEHTINNLGTSQENMTAAESRIRDVDMAKEMMEFTKMNILNQAAQSMLAQANQAPQGVLSLLR